MAIDIPSIKDGKWADLVSKYGSQAAAARGEGIPRSTLRSRLEAEQRDAPIKSDAKILIYDGERSRMEITKEAYDLKNFSKYEKPENITREWCMFGASWMFLDDKTAKVVSVKPDDPFNDLGVIVELHKALSSADILVGHNSDNFDYKVFNTRAIQHGLPPIAPKQSVDTLKLARKYFSFSSNKLSYIADYLGVGMKDESPNWDLVHQGCPDEIRYMRQYNKQDVYVTKNVYLKLRSWDKNHPNVNSYKVGVQHNTCSVCGSGDISKHGYHYTRAGKYDLYRCESCTGFSQGKRNLKTVELR